MFKKAFFLTSFYFVFTILFVNSAIVFATDIEHELIRKIAVFPIYETQNLTNADEAWWQIREALTRDKKLLVASKRFMVNRGVFQSRKALKPADAIILGKLLDAEALMVGFVEERTFKLKAYDGENGYLLWEAETQFHPAISIDEQIVKSCDKLISDFLQSIPYQGFTLYNELSEKVIDEKDGKLYAKVFVGGLSEVQIGDVAQWIELKAQPGKTLLREAQARVIADGVIREINGDEATIEIQNISDKELLQENALVRFPKEFSKLRDLYAREGKNLESSSEYLAKDLQPVEALKAETKGTATGFAFFFSLVGFILVAF